MEDVVGSLFASIGGFIFLWVGSIVVAALATVLYSVTVIAMPLLMDRNVDFVTAMITSVKAVHNSPAVMLGWGATICALTFAGIAPLFLGIVFVFPVLGHTTWHLYQRLVSEM